MTSAGIARPPATPRTRPAGAGRAGRPRRCSRCGPPRARGSRGSPRARSPARARDPRRSSVALDAERRVRQLGAITAASAPRSAVPRAADGPSRTHGHIRSTSALPLAPRRTRVAARQAWPALQCAVRSAARLAGQVAEAGPAAARAAPRARRDVERARIRVGQLQDERGHRLQRRSIGDPVPPERGAAVEGSRGGVPEPRSRPRGAGAPGTRRRQPRRAPAPRWPGRR